MSKVNKGYTTFCKLGKEIYLKKYKQKRRKMKVKYFLVGLAMCAYILYKRLKYRRPIRNIEKDAKNIQKIVKKEDWLF